MAGGREVGTSIREVLTVAHKRNKGNVDLERPPRVYGPSLQKNAPQRTEN